MKQSRALHASGLAGGGEEEELTASKRHRPLERGAPCEEWRSNAQRCRQRKRDRLIAYGFGPALGHIPPPGFEYDAESAPGQASPNAPPSLMEPPQSPSQTTPGPASSSTQPAPTREAVASLSATQPEGDSEERRSHGQRLDQLDTEQTKHVKQHFHLRDATNESHIFDQQDPDQSELENTCDSFGRPREISERHREYQWSRPSFGKRAKVKFSGIAWRTAIIMDGVAQMWGELDSGEMKGLYEAIVEDARPHELEYIKRVDIEDGLLAVMMIDRFRHMK